MLYIAFTIRINGVAQKLIPGSVIKVFGSFYTGLSLPSSDLDLCWVVPWSEDIEPPVTNPGALKAWRLELLKDLAEEMLAQQQCTYIDLRDSARVPIVNLRDRFSSPAVEADVSIYFEGL